ncbi:MAG: GNAT family N-acetyltransferase [Dermatophilaceae bacterium]
MTQHVNPTSSGHVAEQDSSQGLDQTVGQEPGQEPGQVVIRTATGNDLDAVLEVGHRTWPPTYEPLAGADYVAMGLAKWWTPDAVIPSIRTGRTLVAELDGTVIGTATHGVQGEDLVLWKLYVIPGYQGHGVGGLLLRAVCEHASEVGYRRLILSHLEGNDQADAFYAKHGFVETHRESGGSGLPTSVWAALDLPEPEEEQ